MRWLSRDGYAQVTVRYELLTAMGDKMGSYELVYTINGDGDILVENEFNRIGNGLSETPRVGLNIVLDRSFDQVSWYGRGPFENYWDRKTAAFIGRYTSSVEELYFPYIRPQENGHRTDVRWLSLTNEKGMGIRFYSPQPFEFNAHHQDMDTFDPGLKKSQRHVNDVKKQDFVAISIDYKQMGVGGDNSWGARTHEQYTLPAADYKYSYRIMILK